MIREEKDSPRVEQTKKRVRAALLELLLTCDIKKIAVRELCRIAGINRTTFYNHYGSQYDVFDEIAEEYLAQTSFVMSDGLSKGRDIEACFCEILVYVKENSTFARLLLDAGHYDLLSHVSKDMPRFEDMILQNLPATMDPEEKIAVASFSVYGAVKLLNDWIMEGCTKEPREEARLILKIVGRSIQAACR